MTFPWEPWGSRLSDVRETALDVCLWPKESTSETRRLVPRTESLISKEISGSRRLVSDMQSSPGKWLYVRVPEVGPWFGLGLDSSEYENDDCDGNPYYGVDDWRDDTKRKRQGSDGNFPLINSLTIFNPHMIASFSLFSLLWVYRFAIIVLNSWLLGICVT